MRSVSLPILYLIFTLVWVTESTAVVTSFTETFDTDTYQDTEYTTAEWNTDLGVLRLPSFPMEIRSTVETSSRAFDAASYGAFIVVAADEEGILVIDALAPDSAVVVGGVSLGGRRAYGIAIDGAHAYVACGAEGIAVANLADPTSPSVVCYYGPLTNARAIDVEGNVGYVADGDYLQSFDLSDPGNVQRIGAYHADCLDVQTEGDLAFLATETSGLVILDVSDPSNMALVGQEDVGAAATGIAVDGDWAYAAAGIQGLAVIDVTDPGDPGLVTRFDLPGAATDVGFAGDFVYVSDDLMGVSVADVSDPSAPVLVSTLETPDVAWRLHLNGWMGYVADMQGGVHVFEAFSFDIEEYWTSEAFAYSDLIHEIEVHGDFAYMCNGTEGIQIVDVTDPTDPVLASSFDPGHEVRDIDVEGDYAYIVPRLTVLDIRDPAAPSPMVSVGMDASEVVVDGNLAFIAAHDDGLLIYDVRDPANPSVAGRYTPEGAMHSVHAVAVGGDLAAIATHESGQSRLLLLDVLDPSDPVLLDTEYTSDSELLVELQFNGTWLYASGTHGFRIFRVESSPGTLTSWSWLSPDPVYDFVQQGLMIFATGPGAQVRVISVEDPANPGVGEMTGYYDDMGGRALAIVGDSFIWDYEAGQWIMSNDFIHRRYDLDGNRAVSLRLVDALSEIVVARVSPDTSGAILWSLAVDRGIFEYFLDTDFTYFEHPGDSLRWRADLYYLHDEVNPTCEDVTIEWLYDCGPILSIADIPEDQGGQVRLRWMRSGFDFPDSPTLITEYAIYRRIDDFRGAAPAGLKDGREYPPGSWDYVASVPATVDEEYAMVVPTLADSTVTGGMHWSVFFVRALTGSPSEYYNSPPDSGYSVDNLAPSAPDGFRLEPPTLLVWEECAAEDFDYFTVYGSAVDTLDGSAQVIGHTTDTSMDISGHAHAFYHLTATDFAGNEGREATVTGASAAEEPVLIPATFALHPSRPNPGCPGAVIVFDLPAPCRVSLRVFDAAGRLTKTLAEGPHPPGRHAVFWDGSGGVGKNAETGVYFYRLEAGAFRTTRRMIVTR